MNINITIFACLKLIAVHKKFPVKLFVQFIKNQTPLGCHQSAVCIRVALIPYVADGLAFGIDLVHHMNKVMFIIPIVPVAFCHRRIYLFQSALHNIVHLLYGNLIGIQRLGFFPGIAADKLHLLILKFVQNSGSRFVYCLYNFLDVKYFPGSILFYNIHHRFHLIKFYNTISSILLYFFFCCSQHFVFHSITLSRREWKLECCTNLYCIHPLSHSFIVNITF